MTFLFEVVRHTPPWVFLLLAYIVWMGVRGLGERTLPLVRVAIVPVVFILMGVSGALARRQPWAVAVPAWTIGALVGAVPGALTSPRHIVYDRLARRVRFRGSPFPLIRNLVVFSSQYVLAVVAARGGAAGVAVWAIAVSGVSAGYFIGWSGAFLMRLRGAPAAALAQTAAEAAAAESAASGSTA